MDDDEALLRRFTAASDGFSHRLRAVRTDQWHQPTPCPEWTVRDLVNHVTRGNLNYVLLLNGGSGEEFLRLRDADALGDDPAVAFARSAAAFQAACGLPGALNRLADYPLGAAPGRQLLSIRLTDTLVHTWDLARAAGLDESLDPALVDWVVASLHSTYQGIAGSPVAPDRNHRFFAASPVADPATVSAQDRLLHVMGRRP